MALVLAFAALVPALAYLFLVWRLDRYDREPVSLVALCFAWGATGGVVFGIFGTVVLSAPVAALGVGAEGVFSTVFGAPMAEEPAKLAIVVALALFSRHFDGLVDGLVYGAAAGLGFAAAENWLYFLNELATTPENLVALVLMRTGYTMIGHGVASAIAGGGLGFAVMHRTQPLWARLLAPPAALTTAIGLHGLGNGMLIFGDAIGVPGLFFLDAVGCLAVLVGILLVMQVALAGEARMIAAELAPEVARGSVDRQLAEWAASYLGRVGALGRRLMAGDLRGFLALRRRLAHATRLAFELHRAGPGAGSDPAIEALRRELAPPPVAAP